MINIKLKMIIIGLLKNLFIVIFFVFLIFLRYKKLSQNCISSCHLYI